MEVSHFLALIIVLAVFVLAIVIKRWLIDVMLIAVVICTGWFAIVNTWEIMAYPVLVFIGIVSIIMMWLHIIKYDGSPL